MRRCRDEEREGKGIWKKRTKKPVEEKEGRKRKVERGEEKKSRGEQREKSRPGNKVKDKK